MNWSDFTFTDFSIIFTQSVLTVALICLVLWIGSIILDRIQDWMYWRRYVRELNGKNKRP